MQSGHSPTEAGSCGASATRPPPHTRPWASSIGGERVGERCVGRTCAVFSCLGCHLPSVAHPLPQGALVESKTWPSTFCAYVRASAAKTLLSAVLGSVGAGQGLSAIALVLLSSGFFSPCLCPSPCLAGLEDLIPVSLSITLAPSSLGLPPAAPPPALNGVCYDWCAAAGISPRVGVFVAAGTSRQPARRRHPLAAGGSATWRRCCAPAAGGPVHVGSDGASAQGPWPDPAQA